MSYVVAIGEALIDMIEGRCDGELIYWPMPGGSPLNVAVGLARLGVLVEFVGSFADDPLGRRLREFLADNGVGLEGSVEVEADTSLAVTTFEGPDPQFTFYGSPHSFGLLAPERLPGALLKGAAVVHCGSISLLEEPVYRAAVEAFSVEGPKKTVDPNVRRSLIVDLDAYRSSLERLFAMADLVKLSAYDAAALYPGSPEETARRIRQLGAGAVVVTLGARGALGVLDDEVLRVEGREVEAVDTTGAGDAFMAALIAGLLKGPTSPSQWGTVLEFAVDASALTCCKSGGATAMPTREAIETRFGR